MKLIEHESPQLILEELAKIEGEIESRTKELAGLLK